MRQVPPNPPASPPTDHGQVIPLLAVVVVLAGAACLGLGRMGAAAATRAQAGTAADAAALAGALAGEGAARVAAEANRGRLAGYREADGTVWAEVEVGPARATARAQPRERPASGDAEPAGGLAAGLRAALARAGQITGRPVPLDTGGTDPAAPGATAHQRGLAVDVAGGYAEALAAAGPATGLCRPYPETHRNHFELCR